jgi:hypothetical protein
LIGQSVCLWLPNQSAFDQSAFDWSLSLLLIGQSVCFWLANQSAFDWSISLLLIGHRHFFIIFENTVTRADSALFPATARRQITTRLRNQLLRHVGQKSRGHRWRKTFACFLRFVPFNRRCLRFRFTRKFCRCLGPPKKTGRGIIWS